MRALDSGRIYAVRTGLLLKNEVYAGNLVAAVGNVLRRRALNLSDAQVLQRAYAAKDTPSPPVGLLRLQGFVRLLVEDLFEPGRNIPPSHATPYCFLLATAMCTPRVGIEPGAAAGTSQHAECVKRTQEALAQAHRLTRTSVLGRPALRQLLGSGVCGIPVVAQGLLHYLRGTLLDSGFYDRHNPAVAPPHFALLDEIALRHPVLRDNVRLLLQRLLVFSFPVAASSLTVARGITLERLAFLSCYGQARPVLEFLTTPSVLASTMLSPPGLAVGFCAVLLRMVAGPFAVDFVELLVKLVRPAASIEHFRKRATALRTLQAWCREAISDLDRERMEIKEQKKKRLAAAAAAEAKLEQVFTQLSELKNILALF